MRTRLIYVAMLPPLAVLFGWTVLRVDAIGAGDDSKPPATPTSAVSPTNPDRSSRTWTTAVEPKPLGTHVLKGLDWLIKHQLEGGGWGQGEESAAMRGSGNGESLRDKPNVADSCIAALALIRSGSTPRQGPFQSAIANAVRFVCSEVEESDSTSIAVTRVQGTRVQQKLGPNIDTFMASMLLAEVRGRMPDDQGEKRVELALEKVLEKIRKHQKEDGSFDGGGWAPILAQAMCGKGINRARQAGARVPQMVLARAESGARNALGNSAATPAAGTVAAAPALPATAAVSTTSPALKAPASRGSSFAGGLGGAAGVELYARAASVGVLQDSVNTNKLRERELYFMLENSKDAKERDEAKKSLEGIAVTERAQMDAQAQVVARLDDKAFIAGFGSNGGEEFLSYMNLAESLVVKGGEEWRHWDSSMTENLNRIQNEDGSWTGHHCITGRTFCTATALLVLMADRTPLPVSVKAGVKPRSSTETSNGQRPAATPK